MCPKKSVAGRMSVVEKSASAKAQQFWQRAAHMFCGKLQHVIASVLRHGSKAQGKAP